VLDVKRLPLRLNHLMTINVLYHACDTIMSDGRRHMGKTGYITARIEPKLKAHAARVLARVGVSTTDAITMFLRQVVLRNGLPFEVRVPNAETKRAIEELENAGTRSKLKRYATARDMFGGETLGRKKRANRPA
jgi:DNA-damage-inducible protein J